MSGQFFKVLIPDTTLTVTLCETMGRFRGEVEKTHDFSGCKTQNAGWLRLELNIPKHEGICTCPETSLDTSINLLLNCV